jgi:hypothetical protein
MRWDASPEALSEKDANQNCVLKPFSPGISFTRLGVSCYPVTLLSNKLTSFVQLLKEKLTRPTLSK